MLEKPSYNSLEELQLKAALYFLTKGVVRVLAPQMFCKIVSRLEQEVLCFQWNSSVKTHGAVLRSAALAVGNAPELEPSLGLQRRLTALAAMCFTPPCSHPPQTPAQLSADTCDVLGNTVCKFFKDTDFFFFLLFVS